jgi:hypothetical protein
MKKIAFAFALCAVAACSGADNETADTTTVPGIDTTAGLAVPVTDTVIKTTTTDTVQGEARRDSVKDSTASKTKRP